MATIRKTAKYYRDFISGYDIWNCIAVLPEIIRRFGSKRWYGSKQNDYLNVKQYTEFEWNHQIVGFGISSQKESRGRVYVEIYWQGDSTDGDTSEWANDLVGGKTIPAVHEWLGDRTYTEHEDLRISRQEFADAVRAIAKYLAPEDIKARKIAAERLDKSQKVFEFIDAKKKDLDRWEMKGFWNGRIAVQRFLEKDKNLLDRPFEELKAVVDKVWNDNNKN